ncbi:MAG: restriction endonuclease subunit S [Bacteroidales bacterium]|nr:restriction endonuclease subunit S [Bacteroidales bacterium]
MLLNELIEEYSVRNKSAIGYPVYSVTNSQGFCKDYFGKEVASKDKSTYKIVPYGYFAYNPSRINVGSIDWQYCEENVIVSPLYNVFKVNTNKIIQPYLQYYFKSRTVSVYINAFAKGTVRMNLSLATLGTFPIPLPPLETQSRIVSELDLLQSLIDKQKAQLAELDNLAQCIFYDMFGDPVENEKGWEVKKLGSFCSKIGSGATPRGGNESYKSEGISLIRSLNVHNNEFIYKDLAFIDEEQAQALSNVEIQLNDILLNITGASVARCCIVPNQLLPARVNQHVCIIRPSKDAEVRFLSRLLTNSQYQVFLIDLARGKAATREALPKNIVEGLPIILPPLSLQQSFAQKIESIERQKELINQSIREAQTLFDSRMEYYFGE